MGKMNSLLPLSKSWTIRMIFLDMVYGKETGFKVISSLEKEKHLCDDILAAMDCAKVYIGNKNEFNVRDSGTVCRFLMYLLKNKNYKLIKGEQLLSRNLEAVSNLWEMSVQELLNFGTTQFASVALLFGAKPIDNLPIKCQLSVDARKIYFISKGEWVPKFDEVIIRQIKNFKNGGRFKVEIAEDYCYGRAFNLITREEGGKKWPELANHESSRLEVMEQALKNIEKKVNVHDDHRVAMAIALKQKSLGLPVNINNKDCVSKSWPQFWQWLEQN